MVAVAAVLLKSCVKVLTQRLLSQSLNENDHVANSDSSFLAALEKLTMAVAQNTRALERIAESVEALTQQQMNSLLPVPSTPPSKCTVVRQQEMIESSPDSRCEENTTALAEYVEDASDVGDANEVANPLPEIPSLMDLARGSASSLTSPVAAASTAASSSSALLSSASGMLSQQIFGIGD